MDRYADKKSCDTVGKKRGDIRPTIAEMRRLEREIAAAPPKQTAKLVHKLVKIKADVRRK